MLKDKRFFTLNSEVNMLPFKLKVMRLQFVLGQNISTGEPQWQCRREAGGVKVLFVPDLKSALKPRNGQTRFLAKPTRTIFECPDRKRLVVAVDLLKPLGEISEDDQEVEKRVKRLLAGSAKPSTKKAPRRASARQLATSQAGPKKGKNEQPPKHGGHGTSRDARRRARKRQLT